jgi:hypothetical protein
MASIRIIVDRSLCQEEFFCLSGWLGVAGLFVCVWKLLSSETPFLEKKRGYHTPINTNCIKLNVVSNFVTLIRNQTLSTQALLAIPVRGFLSPSLFRKGSACKKSSHVYARVSSHEQHLDSQSDMLTVAGCEKIFGELVVARERIWENWKMRGCCMKIPVLRWRMSAIPLGLAGEPFQLSSTGQKFKLREVKIFANRVFYKWCYFKIWLAKTFCTS